MPTLYFWKIERSGAGLRVTGYTAHNTSSYRKITGVSYVGVDTLGDRAVIYAYDKNNIPQAKLSTQV